ncbi:hypothetical protein EJ04DRAFT_514233 [Polyplosphaeria fusca]|uniref:Uncharacterized protein n=1 Tax=Polyplosphaeria fusca TaxID=682080 RepID=A0A9P4QVY5_9PLEO|nr:hypothetical protein EJ04DRAFT_514233 [Polyplosphaeria fusca]
MKWEPIFNIVFRNLYCRCVILLSTPSRIIEELTIFIACDCPRHNTVRTTYRDYSELTLKPHKDPYFDRYGGYNAFWAIMRYFLPQVYERLGGANAITDVELDHGFFDLVRMTENHQQASLRIFWDYQHEIIDHMVKQIEHLPLDVLANFTEEEAAQRQRMKDEINWDQDEFNKLNGENDVTKDAWFNKELEKVLKGRWNGVPHWAIED